MTNDNASSTHSPTRRSYQEERPSALSAQITASEIISSFFCADVPAELRASAALSQQFDAHDDHQHDGQPVPRHPQQEQLQQQELYNLHGNGHHRQHSYLHQQQEQQLEQQLEQQQPYHQPLHEQHPPQQQPHGDCEYDQHGYGYQHEGQHEHSYHQQQQQQQQQQEELLRNSLDYEYEHSHNSNSNSTRSTNLHHHHHNNNNNNNNNGGFSRSSTDKRNFAQRCLQELRNIYAGLRMTPGDTGSLCQLFFDNLSTILGVLFATQELCRLGGVTSHTMNSLLFQQIAPGLGVTLAIGNLYYAWVAIRLSNFWKRQYTAQPYGINTYSAFAFVYNIIYPVFFATVGSQKEGDTDEVYSPDEAFMLAYRVALASNFVQGMISVLVGIVGPVLLRYIQPVALLVPVAGIGLAFLGLEQLTNCLAAPIVGYNTILWVFLGWYAGVKVGIGKRRIPEALMVILVGVALGWATGLNKAATVRDASKFVTATWPKFTGHEIFQNFRMTREYLGIIIPLGISGPINSLMCLMCAKEAGDPYPVRETLIMDGVGTMIASFFGSPFGTVVYIGHPAHKRSGATVGYSIANGFIYLILSLFGFLAIFQAIVNQATTGPIVFTIGLLVNEEILNFMSPRHFPAYLLGIFPAIYDWVVNIGARTPIEDAETSFNTNLPGSTSFVGVLAWKRGSLLISMVWTSMIVSIIDRKWKHVASWAMVGGVLSLTGIIHFPIAGVDNFSSTVWEQCDSNTGDCWDFGQQWMFVTAYCMIAATALFVNAAKGWDITIQDEIHDSYAYESSNWFADAAVDSHPNLDNNNNTSHSQMTHTFGDVTVMISDNVGYSDGRFRFAIASQDRRVVIDAKTREAGQRWLQSLEISDTSGLRNELQAAHTDIIDCERRIEELEELVESMREMDSDKPLQRGSFDGDNAEDQNEQEFVHDSQHQYQQGQGQEYGDQMDVQYQEYEQGQGHQAIDSDEYAQQNGVARAYPQQQYQAQEELLNGYDGSMVQACQSQPDADDSMQASESYPQQDNVPGHSNQLNQPQESPQDVHCGAPSEEEEESDPNSHAEIPEQQQHQHHHYQQQQTPLSIEIMAPNDPLHDLQMQVDTVDAQPTQNDDPVGDDTENGGKDDGSIDDAHTYTC